MPKKCENCKRLERELRDWKSANYHQLETIRILAERVKVPDARELERQSMDRTIRNWKYQDQVLCNHANENPRVCECPPDCACRESMCRAERRLVNEPR